MTSSDAGPTGGIEPTAFGPGEEYLRHGGAVHEQGWQEVQVAADIDEPPEPGVDGRGTSHRARPAAVGSFARDARVLDRLRARRAEQSGGDR